MKRLVILISGRGSNMQAIVQACEREAWPARVAGVIASRPDAPGLAWAAQRGLATRGLDHRAFADRAAFDAELARCIDELAGAGGADLVVLAGFMRILSERFVRRFEGRLINIHPSLLPAFAGLHTHQRALDSGCLLAGATVHFVTPELDHGPVAAQAAVPVLAGDDAVSLAARVLEVEHRMYPQVLRWWVHGRLEVHGQRVLQRDGEPQWWLAAPPDDSAPGAPDARGARGARGGGPAPTCRG
jgi:phosphoribosylglycinamide formyltransferase-1